MFASFYKFVFKKMLKVDVRLKCNGAFYTLYKFFGYSLDNL